LFEKAAQLGNENAINFMGAYHYNVKRDVQRGVDCFRRAARSQNCARALNNLGICFEKGYGDCQQDFNQALDKYEKSSKLGFVPAMVNRAYLHFKMANCADSELDKSDQFFDCANWTKLALSKNSE